MTKATNFSSQFNLSKWMVFLGLLAFAVLLRFVPHPANFAAMTAIMFLAPLAVRPRFVAVLVAAFAIFLSDLKFGIYPGMSFVYLGYFFIAAIGFFQGHINRTSTSTVQKFFGASVNLLAGATAFFVISNFGVWLLSGMYAKTLQGLIECYVLAIPFFHKGLAAHIFYSISLAALYSLAMAAMKARKQSSKLLK